MAKPGWWARIAGGFQRRKLRRELDRAKSELGLYGWQCADFPTALDGTIAFLRQVEEAQVDLLNHNADLTQTLQQFDERAERARSVYEASCQAIDARLGHAKERGPEALKENQEAIAREKAFLKAVTDLDRQIQELEQARATMVKNQAPGIDGKLRSLMVKTNELRSERQSVDQQRRVWSSKRTQTSAEAAATQSALQRGKKERRRAQRQLMADLGKIRRERSRAFSQKSGSDKEFKRIDRLKVQAYAELGDALANAGIAPPNQPELLQIVLELRETLDEQSGGMQAERLSSD